MDRMERMEVEGVESGENESRARIVEQSANTKWALIRRPQTRQYQYRITENGENESRERREWIEWRE